jgi:anthranilate synthase component 1
MNTAVLNNAFRLSGGAVGYVAYDAVRYWERLPSSAVDDLAFPEVEFGIFDDGIVFDHVHAQAYYYYTVRDRFPELQTQLSTPLSISEVFSSTEPKVNISKDSFEHAVCRAKEYIASGDVFQVVLSKRYDFRVDGCLSEFYRRLRRINPSPYMYYLKFDDRRIIGASPEMLVRVESGNVETYPIAGTCPCTGDAFTDQKLARHLLVDSKERAEHVMLVDLARNDVGKVAEYGSVKVPEFMKVHSFSHVQHIVSKVTGKLRIGLNCFNVFRAMFPAGTVSGAPKVRAMEIIEELEPARRGPYAGAVGYFSYNGNADFAITIRTLYADGERAHVQAGAGIVADSKPEKEWFETEHKAKALLNALASSRGRLR